MALRVSLSSILCFFFRIDAFQARLLELVVCVDESLVRLKQSCKSQKGRSVCTKHKICIAFWFFKIMEYIKSRFRLSPVALQDIRFSLASLSRYGLRKSILYIEKESAYVQQNVDHCFVFVFVFFSRLLMNMEFYKTPITYNILYQPCAGFLGTSGNFRGLLAGFSLPAPLPV